MRLRWFTIAGAAAVAAAGALGVVSTSVAAPSTPKPSEQSLRALGARHGLYVGTAVDMQALDDATDPRYRELVTSQFSTMSTPCASAARAYPQATASCRATPPRRCRVAPSTG